MIFNNTYIGTEIKGSNNNIIIRSFKEDKKRIKNKNYLLKVGEYLELKNTRKIAKNIRYQLKELNRQHNLKMNEE